MRNLLVINIVVLVVASVSASKSIGSSAYDM